MTDNRQTYAPATEAEQARADAVWDAAYADAIAQGLDHPTAHGLAADAVVTDAKPYRPCYLGPQGWQHEPGCPQYETF